MVEIIGIKLPSDEVMIRELTTTEAGMARLLFEFGITVDAIAEIGIDDDLESWYGVVSVHTYPDGSTWTVHHNGPGDDPRHVIASASESVSAA